MFVFALIFHFLEHFVKRRLNEKRQKRIKRANDEQKIEYRKGNIICRNNLPSY